VPAITDVIAEVQRALNAHDLERFLALFDPDYESEQPAHPDRAFAGVDQVRANWSQVFAGVPDFQAELLWSAAAGDVVGAEWRWRGARDDGTALDMAGMTVFGVRDGRIAWARLYMEQVEGGGPGIDATVRTLTGR
jgi:ketosteroid isomerase-like protein